MKKRFNLTTRKLEAFVEKDITSISEQIYMDLGKRFPITWKDDIPIIEASKLPSGLTMLQVEQELNKVL